MSRTITVGWTLDGREVQVEASICPAEDDVGIMSAYPEGIRILDDGGTLIELSDEKLEELMEDPKLQDKLLTVYYDSVSDWPDNVI